MLLRSGLLAAEQLAEALEEKEETGERLGEIVVRRGWVGEEALARTLGEQLGLEFIDLTMTLRDQRAQSLLSPSVAAYFRAVPIRFLDDSTVLVAVTDPTSPELSSLAEALGVEFRLAIATASSVDGVLEALGPGTEGPIEAPARGEEPPLVQPETSEPPPAAAAQAGDPLPPGEAPLTSAGTDEADEPSPSGPDREPDPVIEGPTPAQVPQTSSAAETRRMPIGKMLLRAGLIGPERLAEALAEQEVSGERLGRIIVHHGWISERDLARVLAEQHDLRFVELSAWQPDPAAVSLLPEDVARRYCALPLRFTDDGTLLVAVADPARALASDAIRLVLNRPIELALAVESAIVAALDRAYEAPQHQQEPQPGQEPVAAPEAVHEPALEPDAVAEPEPVPEPDAIAELEAMAVPGVEAEAPEPADHAANSSPVDDTETQPPYESTPSTLPPEPSTLDDSWQDWSSLGESWPAAVPDDDVETEAPDQPDAPESVPAETLPELDPWLEADAPQETVRETTWVADEMPEEKAEPAEAADEMLGDPVPEMHAWIDPLASELAMLAETAEADSAPSGEPAPLISPVEFPSVDLDHELELAERAAPVEEPSRTDDAASDGDAIHLTAREAGGASAAEIVDDLLSRALREGASDVYVVPRADALVTRRRIDGVLREPEPLAAELHEPVAARLKELGGLDPAIGRSPREGRVTVEIDGMQIDLRVSVLPTIDGEHVAVGLSPAGRLAARTELAALGLGPEAAGVLKEAISNPDGLVLVAGPRASGRTTTLHAALRLLQPDRFAVSIEDPVDARLDGVSQVEVDVAADLAFASGLRTILRWNPDVVLVGELRDAETARLAVEAATTGRLVLAALCCDDASASVSRLASLGVDRQLLASGLTAVVGQRLVRRLCASCRVPRVVTRHALVEAGVRGAGELLGDTFTVHDPGGCPDCHDGYRGRLGLYEVMAVTPRVQPFIVSASRAEIHAVAVHDGMRPQSSEALRACLEGHTSLEEIVRLAGAPLRPGVSATGIAPAGDAVLVSPAARPSYP